MIEKNVLISKTLLLLLCLPCDAFCRNPNVQDDNPINFLETPFQKSMRLLNSAVENITDPVVKRQLKRVAKLLSDPDSLHTVKEGSIRYVPWPVTAGLRPKFKPVQNCAICFPQSCRRVSKLDKGMPLFDVRRDIGIKVYHFLA